MKVEDVTQGRHLVNRAKDEQDKKGERDRKFHLTRRRDLPDRERQERDRVAGTYVRGEVPSDAEMGVKRKLAVILAGDVTGYSPLSVRFVRSRARVFDLDQGAATQTTAKCGPMKPELLAKYGRRVPRYTSYPTAPHFHAGVGPDTYARWLDEIP